MVIFGSFTSLATAVGVIFLAVFFASLIGNGASDVVALANADGSNTLTVGAEDLSLTGGTLSIGTATEINTVAAASTAVAAIEAGLDNLNTALARLGTGSKALEIHNTFVTKLSDALERGIGNLVDADLAKESARLQSLQVKQQLGTQALSIANSAPSSILSYFR